jgi:hypothetical protein
MVSSLPLFAGLTALVALAVYLEHNGVSPLWNRFLTLCEMASSKLRPLVEWQAGLLAYSGQNPYAVQYAGIAFVPTAKPFYETFSSPAVDTNEATEVLAGLPLTETIIETFEGQDGPIVVPTAEPTAPLTLPLITPVAPQLDLDSMTVKQLREYAADTFPALKLASKLRKADIIKTIKQLLEQGERLAS